MNSLQKLNGSQIEGYDEGLLGLLAEEDSAEEHAFRFYATRLKFPSGGMITGFATSDDELIPVPFEGIILISQVNRAWWPRVDGDNAVGGAPFCSSNDGVTGTVRMTDAMYAKAAQFHVKHPALRMIDQGANVEGRPFNCATCPLAQYIEGKGTPCKELRRQLILVQGMTTPVILTVPTGSIGVFDRYASAQKAKGRRYFGVWTKFELERDESRLSGAKYARLKLSFVRACTADELYAVIEVRRQYGELVRSMTVTDEDYSATADNGVAVEAEPSVPF